MDRERPVWVRSGSQVHWHRRLLVSHPIVVHQSPSLLHIFIFIYYFSLLLHHTLPNSMTKNRLVRPLTRQRMYEESLVGPWFRRDGISLRPLGASVRSRFLIRVAALTAAKRCSWLLLLCLWMQSGDESNISGVGSEVRNIPPGVIITAAEWLRHAISLLNLVFLLLLFFPLFLPGDDSDRKSEVWAAPCEAASSSFLFSCYLL